MIGTNWDITEIKQAEEKLQKSLKEVSEYKNALQNQSHAISKTNSIIEFDLEGNIITANDNFLKLFGYLLEEIKGKHHQILLKEEQKNTGEYREFWKRVMKGDLHVGEFERKTKDGQTIWILGSYNMIYNVEGKFEKVLKIVTDITDRKKAEEALRNSLKEVSDYKYALDESSIVAITDQKGIIRQVNDNFCKISKYTREELIGQDHRIMNSGFHTKEFIRDMWQTISKGEVWHAEVKNKAKDGTYYWLDSTIVPFMNEHGEAYQYLAIRSDITERKNLEAEIKQFNLGLEQKVKERTAELYSSEEKYRTIVDTTDEMIHSLSAEGKILWINESWRENMGFTDEEVIGKNLIDFLDEPTQIELGKVLPRLMNGERVDAPFLHIYT